MHESVPIQCTLTPYLLMPSSIGTFQSAVSIALSLPAHLHRSMLRHAMHAPLLLTHYLPLSI